MAHAGTHGIVYPDELDTLESVFEEACRTSKINRGSADAERIALKIMLFQSGMDERDQLLEAAINCPSPRIRTIYSLTDPAAGSAVGADSHLAARLAPRPETAARRPAVSEASCSVFQQVKTPQAMALTGFARKLNYKSTFWLRAGFITRFFFAD
jgi:hypothetical protein